MLGLIRQMGVANRRENRVMAENALNLGELDARLDEVRGIGVTQAVWRNVFFSPQDSTTARSAFWTPLRSSGVLAVRTRAKPPWRLGNSSTG